MQPLPIRDSPTSYTFLEALMESGPETALTITLGSEAIAEVFSVFLQRLGTIIDEQETTTEQEIAGDSSENQNIEHILQLYDTDLVFHRFKWFRALYVPDPWIYEDEIIKVLDVNTAVGSRIYMLLGPPVHPGSFIRHYNGNLNSFIAFYRHEFDENVESLLIGELLCANKFNYLVLFGTKFKQHADVVLKYVLEHCEHSKLEKALYGYFNMTEDVELFITDLEQYQAPEPIRRTIDKVIRNIRNLPFYVMSGARKVI